jgi:pseudouridine synthase
MRLNKILSAAGVASRRAADRLIAEGRVEVNGRVVATLGAKADPARDEIRVDGRRLAARPARRYVLLYKPRGIVSTRIDPQRRTTVIDLLAAQGVEGYFYPVGRLDHDSEGLIILTNDGDLALRVMHPRYELERTYEADVAGVPDARDLDRLRRGVEIDGRRTLPASARLVRVVRTRSGPQAVIELVLREGRNRQVRKMCDAIGHPVERLRRTRLGTISAKGLKPGHMRELTPAEIRTLMSTAAPSRTAPAARRRRTQSARPRLHA